MAVRKNIFTAVVIFRPSSVKSMIYGVKKILLLIKVSRGNNAVIKLRVGVDQVIRYILH